MKQHRPLSFIPNSLVFSDRNYEKNTSIRFSFNREHEDEAYLSYVSSKKEIMSHIEVPFEILEYFLDIFLKFSKENGYRKRFHMGRILGVYSGDVFVTVVFAAYKTKFVVKVSKIDKSISIKVKGGEEESKKLFIKENINPAEDAGEAINFEIKRLSRRRNRENKKAREESMFNET